MGSKAEVTYNWLKSTKLTPIQLIYTFIAIFAFIFMATDIFDALPDIIRVSIYGSVVLIGVLLGVSIFNIKQLAKDMKAIYEDKNMTSEEKVNAYGNIALVILNKLGEAWQLYTNEQFEQIKQVKIDDLQAKIKELEDQLNQ